VVTASNVFQTIESMSVSITSFALASESTFPFVTIPHYEQQSEHLLHLSGSLFLAYSPLVTETERPFWEQYSKNNQGWMSQSLSSGSVTGLDQIAPDDEITPFIWKFDNDDGNAASSEKVPEDLPEPPNRYYAPYWQVTPARPEQINFNSFRLPSFVSVFDAMNQSNVPTLSSALNLNEVSPNVVEWPESVLAAPIFETLDPTNRKVVAVYSAVIPWHFYLENVLPDTVKGIYVVITNTCQQSFTYLVHGPIVTYVGPVDLHEWKYDDLMMKANFTYAHDDRSVESTDRQHSTCHYTLQVYPSVEFRESFKTGAPWVYTVVVIAIFVFVSMVFVFYDCLVQHRQIKILDAAARSAALVSRYERRKKSLFGLLTPCGGE
jgi:hypothetical protein